jgi:uncharacterized protein (TIGR02996 family)
VKQDRSGFWKSICAEPDEDVHRLVYADWLQEQGESARAEFIRVQCELARLPIDDDRRVELEVRERSLLQEHRPAWLEELPKWVPRDFVTFRRGFPWSLHCTPAAFLRNAPAVGKRTVLQEVSFVKLTPADAERIAALPLGASVRSLRNTGGTFAVLRPLLTAFSGLRALALYGPCFDDGDPVARLTDLLAIPSVRRLTQLKLLFRSRDEREASLAIHSVAATPFTEMKALSLQLEGPAPEALAALLRAPFVRGLETLVLFGDMVNASALEVLAAAETLTGLRCLDLSLPERGSGFAALARSPHLRKLADLSIIGFDEACDRALASSSLTDRLRYLEVWSPDMAEGEKAMARAVRHLVESGRLARLAYLRVIGGDFTDADWLALAAGPYLPALVHLDLGIARLTESALAGLARSPQLPSLQAVTVPDQLLGPSGDDPDALRALNEQYAGRFAVLVSPPAWASGKSRLGAY